MARRFSGFRNRMIRSGRKTFWLSGAHIQTTMAAANTAVLVSSLNAAALALRPFTIVRSRGFWTLTSDQTAATEGQSVAHGLIVVSDQAVAIGVTAVPTPVVDDGSSWHVLDAAATRFTFISGVGVAFNTMPERYVIDSKAMRKVEEGQDLIQVVATSGVSSGAIVHTYMRTLIKLH